MCPFALKINEFTSVFVKILRGLLLNNSYSDMLAYYQLHLRHIGHVYSVWNMFSYEILTR
jgi:hypothetical protein